MSLETRSKETHSVREVKDEGTTNNRGAKYIHKVIREKRHTREHS